MKKSFLKIFSFVLSLTIGVGFVWFSSLMSKTSNKQIWVIEPPPYFTEKTVALESLKSVLEIKFKGFDDFEFDQEARFEITNLSDETLIYGSPGVDLDEPLFICNELKINGGKINLRKSCDGLEDYELKPGESKIFRVTLNYYFWRKEKTYQVGFNFRRLGEKKINTFWSESLPFTKSIAKRFLMKQKKYGVD